MSVSICVLVADVTVVQADLELMIKLVLNYGPLAHHPNAGIM